MDIRSFVPKRLRPLQATKNSLEILHQEINQLFERAFSNFYPLLEHQLSDTIVVPLLDISETEEEISVTVDLPGIDEKDIEVSLSNKMLLIKGERKIENEDKQKTYHLIERSYGSFIRTVAIPFEVDPDKVNATFKKGVLRVILPKPPEAIKPITNIKVRHS